MNHPVTSVAGVVTTYYTVPHWLMIALQVAILVLVAAGAALVVFTRQPKRQVVAVSAYGLLLALLFVAFQAPDVALSALTVGSVALPLFLLLALSKMSKKS